MAGTPATRVSDERIEGPHKPDTTVRKGGLETRPTATT